MVARAHARPAAAAAAGVSGTSGGRSEASALPVTTAALSVTVGAPSAYSLKVISG